MKTDSSLETGFNQSCLFLFPVFIFCDCKTICSVLSKFLLSLSIGRWHFFSEAEVCYNKLFPFFHVNITFPCVCVCVCVRVCVRGYNGTNTHTHTHKSEREGKYKSTFLDSPTLISLSLSYHSPIFTATHTHTKGESSWML